MTGMVGGGGWVSDEDEDEEEEEKLAGMCSPRGELINASVVAVFQSARRACPVCHSPQPNTERPVVEPSFPAFALARTSK
jgi:hypothetical protein